MLASAALFSALVAFAPAGSSRPVKRGNAAYARRAGPVFTLGVAPRLGILLAGGADVIQPLGFGAGLSFQVHALHIGPFRLGAGAMLGHTRFVEKRVLTAEIDGSTQAVERYAALGHTDFGLGPSLQILLGPVYLQGDFTAGLGISTLSRPLGVFTVDEDQHSDYSAMIRGGGLFGLPIRNNQGITVGAHVHRYFSRHQVVGVPPMVVVEGAPEPEPDTNPFDVMVDVSVGYTFMF